MDKASRFAVKRPVPILIGLLTVALFTVAGCGRSGSSGSSGTTAGRPPGATPEAKGCPNGVLPTSLINGGNLVISNECHVTQAGIYEYDAINIVNNGSLIFNNDNDANYKVDLWASAIIIENGGAMIAGFTTEPWGSNGGTLTVHLYGRGPEKRGGAVKPALCRTEEGKDVGPCGVPNNFWKVSDNTNGNKLDKLYPATCKPDSELPSKDCFYQYNPLPGDTLFSTKPGYFGNKVLALSYGGTLDLYGWKGATYDAKVDANPADTGDSWVRLDNCDGKSCTSVPAGTTQLVLSHKVNWQPKDSIVVTSTDYVMSHSEVHQIKAVSSDGLTVTLEDGLKNPHVAKVYDLQSRVDPKRSGLTDLKQVDTRAAVGLLTRSIRIVSGGDKLGEEFPLPPTYPSDTEGYYYGGHTVYRQGFKQLQLQGVEFYQLGQGGRIAHYPVHFHLARKVPADTFVKDCSVWDSMTRWYVIHNTSGVTLQRDVGLRSYGHGYYLEDATETNNKLYANLGVSAVAAAYDALNPRRVPGILNAPNYPKVNDAPVPKEPNAPYHSDVNQPTVFWITNGWNDFQYNMAVGADTCGTCFWMVPAYNSTAGRYMHWTGYASEQKDHGHAATTPLMSFIGNTCSTAPNSFNVVGNEGACNGVGMDQIGPTGDGADHPGTLQPVKNPFISKKEEAPSVYPPDQKAASSDYYPNVDQGGGRFPSICTAGEDGDCSTTPRCGTGADCGVTVLDHYTTSFNFAQSNFAALWLRPHWYLLVDSAITDVQFGGVTFVTGGSWTYSDFPVGTWQVAYKDVFVGHTQPQDPKDSSFNPYAEDDGPFNPQSLKLDAKFKCDNPSSQHTYCLSKNNGVDVQLVDFAVNQRLYNIYDGPNVEDSNAYLDVTPTTLTDCSPVNSGNDHNCENSTVPYGRIKGIRRDGSSCYLPNAAIAWKQPNGFFYPPAFHSKNLYFNNAEIRHFVIEPLYKKNGFDTDVDLTREEYCTFTNDMWTNFSDVDRQTELTDDDGTLTGLVSGSSNPYGPTISVNEDSFFTAPEETAQCASDKTGLVPPGTAKTSPYDFETSVVYPDCGNSNNQPASCGDNWAVDCTHLSCYGVPLYRQLLTPSEYSQWKSTGERPSIRMAGQAITQRSTLTVNHGDYYIETTVPAATQKASGPLINAFEGGKRYHVFLLYATPSTRQTYRLFVGADFEMSTLKAERASINTGAVPFTTVDPKPSSWIFTPPGSDGILTVTIDDSFSDFKTRYDTARANLCQPAAFCQLDNGVCKFKDPDNIFGYLLTEYGQSTLDQICQENNQDVDCPEGGCYGFGFTLPADFVTKAETAKTPDPSCLTLANNPSFATALTPVDSTTAGSCFYNAPPPSGLFCATPKP